MRKICSPFDDNEDVHVTKEDPEQKYLGDEFMNQVVPVTEMYSVETFHKDSKRHL